MTRWSKVSLRFTSFEFYYFHLVGVMFCPLNADETRAPVASPLAEPSKGTSGVTPGVVEPHSGLDMVRTEVSTSRDLEVVGLNASSSPTEGVGHNQICGLLIERLQDISCSVS
jgi:hypothetical protein